MFLSANSGTYVLEANTPTWCNAFVTVTGAGNNPPGTQILNVSNAASINVNTALGVMLDSGNIQFTTVNTVNVVANTVTINNPLVSSMNSINNLLYVITDNSSQPPQTIETCVLRDINRQRHSY
jgi:hypothetical protein